MVEEQGIIVYIVHQATCQAGLLTSLLACWVTCYADSSASQVTH